MNNNEHYENGSANKNDNQKHDAIMDDSLEEQQLIRKQQRYQQIAIKYMQSEANRQIQRKRALIKQVHEFVNAKNKFQSEDFYDRKFVYLVSKKWLQKWKELTNYQQIVNFQKISLFQSRQVSSLGCMNEDLVDEQLSPTLKFKPDSPSHDLQHYNIALRQTIRQSQDFEFFSQEMWNTIKRYQNIEVKRQIVELSEGKEKLVDVYLQKMIVHFISKDILNEIKAKREQQPPMHIIQFSKFKTFAYFQLTVRELIFDQLSLNGIKQIIPDHWRMNFWFFDPIWNSQRFIKRVNASIKYQSSLSEYTVCLLATPIDASKTLDEQLGVDNPIILCQVVPLKVEITKTICYNSEIGVLSLCPRCLKTKQLEARCKCQKMIYCSQDCLNSHIDHIKQCPYREKLRKKTNNGTNQKAQNSKNGLVGLVNLGNTCFMNSGIQCLSFIYQLTNYFITNAYESDINLDNPLGTKGNLSRAYSNMMKNLWCKNISAYSAIEFKRNISAFQRMFSGFQQHDAGQFLCYLLNGLHEDLNKIKKKPYFESKDFDNRPDEVIADEQWRNFLRRQNSKIVDLMYGQFRSQLTCPNCEYRSIQFDPFLMCSLPIPAIQSGSQKFKITFQNQQDLSEQTFCFTYDSRQLMKDIIEQLRYKKKIPQSKKIIVYTQKTIFQQSTLISDTTRYKNPIYARILTQNQSQHGYNVFVTFTSNYMRITSQQLKQTLIYKLYKFRLEITFIQVHHILYEKYRKFLDAGDYKQIVCKPSNQKQIRLIFAKSEALPCWVCKNSMCKGCQFPYRDKPIEQLSKLRNLVALQYLIKEKISSQKVKRTVVKQSTSTITLMDCFDYFQQPQILKKGNQWNCPKCKQQVSARKEMMIYKSPKILMICLKRFQKKGYYSNKIKSLVDFPINNLDLTKIVINSQLPKKVGPDEWKQKQKTEVVYDLFAVSYHLGDTGGGHYVAACKTNNNKWYEFNDDRVNAVSESKVINEGAYILFYRRKQV